MRIDTLAVRAGYDAGPPDRSVVPPIHQTASFVFDNMQHAEDLFSFSEPGQIYSRIRNPTNEVLEQRVCALEGGVGALAVASGQAAVAYSVMNLAGSGDNIICASEVYGGSHTLFARVLPGYGVGARFAPDLTPAAIARLIDRNTKAVFCETIGNPSGRVADLASLAEVAHSHGLPLIVDNSVASPCLSRPIEHGADIVVHSLTKYLGGHGNSIGGILVDSGRFPWTEHAERFVQIVAPDAAYQGLVYPERFGAGAYIARARAVMLRNFGASLAPFNAFLALQGIETLPVRMDRICDSTRRIAIYLKSHPRVSWVRYAGLADHPDHALAQRYLGGRASGLLSFGIDGGKVAVARVYDAFSLIMRMANIGDTRSLAVCPAATTHRQLSPAQRGEAGVSDDMIRLSIGLEHIDDLLADLDQALEHAGC